MKRPDLSVAIARGKARVRAGEGVLYVAECGNRDRIKIGHALNLERRIRELGCRGQHVRLLGSFPAPIEAERAFHKRMRPLRTNGEYYPRSIFVDVHQPSDAAA